jgi:hypothetical protein
MSGWGVVLYAKLCATIVYMDDRASCFQIGKEGKESKFWEIYEKCKKRIEKLRA